MLKLLPALVAGSPAAAALSVTAAAALSVTAADRFMDARGYYISLDSFQGPFLDAAAVRNSTSKLPWNNIFCVRKQLVDA